MADAHHADPLALDDAADALDLVAQVARAEGRRRCPLVGEAELVNERIHRRRVGRAARSRNVSVPGVLGVAVQLLFALLSRTAVCLAATDDASVSLADASTEAPEDLAILVSPAPDAGAVVSLTQPGQGAIATYR
jgi:hypothetical protein